MVLEADPLQLIKKLLSEKNLIIEFLSNKFNAFIKYLILASGQLYIKNLFVNSK